MKKLKTAKKTFGKLNAQGTNKVAAEGRVVATGRARRAIETLQQRVMNLEQLRRTEPARLRHAKTRDRLLFQIASEALLIVDPSAGKVSDANPAACRILGAGVRRFVGRKFPEGFDAQGGSDIEALLAVVRATGRGEVGRARLTVNARELAVSAWLFRQDDAPHFLVRLLPIVSPTGADATGTAAPSRLLQVLEGSPDGIVVTNPVGRILTANRAFLNLAQLATAEQARGQPLDRWLGRQGVDLRVLIGNLRRHGAVRLFATTLRGEYGSNSEVDVSAVAVGSGKPRCLGFTLRNVESRTAIDLKASRELPRSASELTKLIGRVPLTELVREITEVIERLCIEAALKLTAGKRATAADLLGLSRQSLYTKLRRYGLSGFRPDEG